MTEDSSEEDYPDLSDIPVNEKDKEFLTAIYDIDGPAKTREIRNRTGLDSGATKYRFTKFDENGIIEKKKEESDNPKYHNRQNVAVLTERGKEFINKGFTGSEIFDEERTRKVELTLEEYEELVEDIDQLENKITLLQKEISEIPNDIEADATVSESDIRDVLVDMDLSASSGQSDFELQTRVESLENVTNNLMETIEELQEQHVSRNKVRSLVNEQVDIKLGNSDHPAVKSYEESQEKQKGTPKRDIKTEEKLGELEDRVKEVEKDINYFYDWIQKSEVFLLALKLFFKDQEMDIKPYLKEAKERQSS